MNTFHYRGPAAFGGRHGNIGGEGRDSNPRVVLPTTAGALAAALANGDLSTHYLNVFLTSVIRQEAFGVRLRLVGDILFFYWINTREREQLAEVIKELDQQSHEAMKSE